MRKLRYYTQATVENLRTRVQQHLDWYYFREGEPPPMNPIEGVRQSKLELPDLEHKMVIGSNKPSSTDRENALIVYTSLRKLTSHQASIERMWVYLCHCICPDYITWRWLGIRRSDQKAVREVSNHFFAKTDRSLIRDNGLSRLWWLGKIAHDVDPDDPLKFLTILLYRQDVRAALIERPSVSMNIRTLRAIYSIMEEHWGSDRLLFKREVFRSWMVALNRRGGVVLLDSLSKQDLNRLLREEVERALEL